jgi:hypothetical protein
VAAKAGRHEAQEFGHNQEGIKVPLYALLSRHFQKRYIALTPNAGSVCDRWNDPSDNRNWRIHMPNDQHKKSAEPNKKSEQHGSSNEKSGQNARSHENDDSKNMPRDNKKQANSR